MVGNSLHGLMVIQYLFPQQVATSYDYMVCWCGCYELTKFNTYIALYN